MKPKNSKSVIVKDAITIIACNIFTGLLISSVNVTESGLTQGITDDLMVRFIVTYGLIFLLRYFLRCAEKELRNEVINEGHISHYEKSLNSHVSAIQDVSVGTIFDAVKEYLSMKGNYMVALLSLITTLIPAVSLIVKEILYAPLCGIVTIISIIVAFLVTWSCDKIFKWHDKATKLKGHLQKITADNYLNIMTIKYMGFGDFCKKRLIDSQIECQPYFVNKKKFAFFRLVDITYIANMVISMLICRDSIEMIALIIMASYSVQNLSNHLANLVDSKDALSSQLKILKDIDGSDDKPKLNFKGKMELKNIVFGYEPSEGCDMSEILFYINDITISFGKRYLITGESGEGKSTFANLLAGILRPFEGNMPIYNLFYISQSITALNDTLWNNIVGSNEFNISKEEVLELFDLLGLMKWFKTLNDGFNTQIGERGCRLSFGQMQRVNIIRAVLCMRYQPEKIFILDEITSNLDKETRSKAISLINNECKSTCVIISHNPGFEDIVDEHILVENHTFEKVNKLLSKTG